jgi:uncharacterized protein YjbJ (UPF0337 family)
MDKQRVEGRLKKATGTVKEKVGETIGNRHLEDEGRGERVEGHVRDTVGKAKDTVREIAGKK